MRAGGFEMRRGDAAWQHDEEIHREMFGGFQNVADSVETENIGILVRINHHRASAVRDNCAHEFRCGEHGTFYVKMSVDQAGREIRALHMYRLFCFVIAKTNDPAIL